MHCGLLPPQRWPLSIHETRQEQRLRINRLAVRMPFCESQLRVLFSSFDIISPVGADDLIELRAVFRILERETALHSPETIARHPVRTRQVDFAASFILESVDPAMFKEPADDTAQSNIIAYPGNMGSQATDTAH